MNRDKITDKIVDKITSLEAEKKVLSEQMEMIDTEIEQLKHESEKPKTVWDLKKGDELAKMREESYRELQDLKHHLSLQERLSHKSMMVINEEMEALRAALEEKRKQLAEKEVETEEDTEDWGGYEDWEEELEKEEEEEIVAELYDKKDWEYKDGWYYPPNYEEEDEELNSDEFDSDEFFQEVYEDALQHMGSVVHHPKHYNQYGDLEVIDIITEATKNMQGDKGYVFGNILKYLLRAPFKGKFEEDVAKANWYWEYYKHIDKRVEGEKE